MWSKNIIPAFLLVIVAYSEVQGEKNKNVGVLDMNCPLDDDPNDPTHLPLQGDCSKFLKCSYGKAYTLSCPRGQEWSIALDRCESPYVAKCDPTATTPKPVLGAGCSFDIKRHPTDCNKALQCASGIESTIVCLDNMFWDQDHRKCVYDDSVCP